MKRLLFLILFLFAFQAYSFGANSVTLAWDPNPENDIGGYIVYYGSTSRNYTNAINVGNVTTNTVSGLVDGATYFFAVTAYNTNGLESDFSDEVSYSRPPSTPVLRALPPTITRLNVTLLGTSSVQLSLSDYWFEIRPGLDTNWTRVTATTLGPTNSVMMSLPPTNWTARFCGSNVANIYRSPTITFDNRSPLAPLRLRFEVKVIESASLNGPWTESMQAVLLVPMPVQEPQKFYQTVFNYSKVLN